jgi:hypothetical protein
MLLLYFINSIDIIIFFFLCVYIIIYL